MRFWRTLAFALALAAAPGPVPAGENADSARQLRAAAEPLLSPSLDDTACTRALVEVLGLAAQAAERGNLPAAVRAKLGEAHAAWRRRAENLPDPGVQAALGEAYAGLHGGHAFQFPAGVRTIDQAREVCRKQIDGAAGALEAGRLADATRGMLEFVLTVTTPMEAH